MRLSRWFVVLALIAGCNGSSVVPVSGRITLDSQPLAAAVVIFEPIDGKPNAGMGSTGRTDADGRYVLRQIQPDRPGAIVGKHRVRITAAPAGSVSEDNPPQEPIPAIYNSKTKLTYEVLPGGTQSANFDLLSKPK